MSKAKPRAATTQMSHWTPVKGGGSVSAAGGRTGSLMRASNRSEAADVNGLRLPEKVALQGLWGKWIFGT